MTTLLTLLGLLAFASIPASASTSEYCYVDGNVVKYDIQLQICCGGKLKAIFDNARCCQDNGQVYDAATQICCGPGPVTDIPAGTWNHLACCRAAGSAQLYSTQNKECCMGHLHDLRRGRWPYKRFGFCCGTDFVDTTYTEGYKSCCQNPRRPEISAPYDLQTQTCCAGHVSVREGSKFACCGDEAYDQSEKVCCQVNGHDTLFSSVGYGPNACCKNAPGGVIDKTSHVCLNDEPYERECRLDDHQEDETTGCCANFLHYNKTTETCCADKVIPIEMECCGGFPGEAGQVCCGPVFGPVDPSSPYHDSCCHTDTSYQTYNSTQSVCEHGVVIPTAMCGNTRYNPKKKACCNGNLHVLMKGYGCCGKHFYHPKYLKCCDTRRLQARTSTCL